MTTEDLLNRLIVTEKEVVELRTRMDAMTNTIEKNGKNINRVRRDLPSTNLLSHSFLNRAFTIVGHQIVVSLIFYGVFILIGIFASI